MVDAGGEPPRWWKRHIRRNRVTQQLRAADLSILVERLVDQPRRLSELEEIIGEIHMSSRPEDRENMGLLSRPRIGESGEFSPLIPRLSITYAWDRYHEDPTRRRDVELVVYTLHLRAARTTVERVLHDRFGRPRNVVDTIQHPSGSVSTTSYAAFHPFYLADCGHGIILLRWFAHVPGFAIPKPDDEMRGDWLADLSARIDRGHSVDEIDAFCRCVPQAVGIEIVGTLSSRLNPATEFTFPVADARDYWIRFVPPVGASTLVEAFGWEPAVGVSYDVHQSSWHIERCGTRGRPVSGALSHWQVTAHLAGRPTGAPEPEAGGPGPFTPMRIGPGDEVTGLAVQPRLR